MYNLSFFEAIERCANGEGYIRGDKFRDGVYVKKHGEALVAIDAFNSNKTIGNFYISTGIMEQKYKLFQIPEEEELTDGNDRVFLYYDKAI